jgi:hypothetical protein
MTGTARIEAALIRVIEDVGSEYDGLLQQRGLRMESPKVSVLRHEAPSYSSEIQIDIIQIGSGQLIDRLEFFAFEGGKPQVTDEELRVWLIEQFSALAKEQP